MEQVIVITRPAHQAQALSQGIKAAGGDVCLFPTLEIIPTSPSQQHKDTIQKLDKFDIIIFISPNAVDHGLNFISKLPTNALLATIGQGSANQLKRKLGKDPDIVPAENFNSEGLLATNAMQNVENKRILIVRGNAGREVLKQSLEKRGAIVEYLSVYQRMKPATDSTDLEQYLQNSQVAAIVITSAQSLKNLLEMTPKKAINQLLQTPLLLIHQRLVNIAKEAKFTGKLMVATQANDEAMIKTLKENSLL